MRLCGEHSGPVPQPKARSLIVTASLTHRLQSGLVPIMRRSVLVVDDHPVIRLVFQMVLDGSSKYEFCGEASSVRTALSLAPDLQPDIIILDLMLDGRDGMELIKELRSLVPDSHILVFSALNELQYAERSIRAGASGYVHKSAGLAAVLEALEQISSNGWYASHSVQSSAFTHLVKAKPGQAAPSLECLSDREIDVFRMTGSGLSATEIAAKLNLSRKTVSTYRERIKNKLAFQSGRDLEKKAGEFFLTGHLSLDTL